MRLLYFCNALQKTLKALEGLKQKGSYQPAQAAPCKGLP
jgi:hypothetical protein